MTAAAPNRRQPSSATDDVPSWRARLTAPVDIAGIAVFRVALGAILLVEMLRFLALGWVHDFIAPVFHFTYYGFEWVRPLPPLAMIGLFVALGVLALSILLGWRYRLTLALFLVGFTYIFLLDKALYMNHFYLVCLVCFVMLWAPAGRAFSLDARRPGFASDYAPAWALWLLRLQMAIPYVFGAIAKLNGDWLLGQPMQLWMSRMAHVRAVVPAFGEPWLALVFAWGGFLIDLLVVPLLLWKRTRLAAFCVAVAFHLMNAVMFEIGIFPWFMIAATTLFFDPDWPRRLLRRLPRATRPMPARLANVPGGRWGIVVLGIFLLVQLALPLRHWFYPGQVDWTEEGTRFAWRMMLNDKASAVQFLAVAADEQQATPIDIRPFLTPRQLDKMSHDPEMIREFAAFLGRHMRSQGDARQVHAIVFCALNGRKPQRLVDPGVDLSRVPRRLGHAPWIVPLTEPLPDKAWDVPPSRWQQTFDLQ